MDLASVILATIAFALGGMLKGATGAGAPVVGVPVLALIFDVRFAVAVFAVPNLFSNIWQGWHFRAHQGSRRFVVRFAIAGAVGAGIGTFLLAWLSAEILMGTVAGIVLVYVAFRLLRPNWRLSAKGADKLVFPAGLIGGALQGAGGISAPVSVTFLNAIRLERSEFIATITVFFTAMSIVQIPTLYGLGLLTGRTLIVSVLSIIPLFGFMPVGDWLARHVSKEVFDRLILVLLTVIAIRLIYTAMT